MSESTLKLPEGALPDGFQFSQSSLQDYVDCPRRFQLRYILHCAWPAVQSEPILENERFLKAGALFHRMAHQLFSGVPEELLRRSIADDQLRLWWGRFIDFLARTGIEECPGRRSEVVLSAPIVLDRFHDNHRSPRSFRLNAKYDLIVCDATIARASSNRGQSADVGCVIYDWKTSQRRPNRLWLADRLQTRVYPFLLVRAGASLLGGSPIEPGAVEMVYWFSGSDEAPIKFSYREGQFEADSLFLSNLIAEIAELPRDGFTLTSDDRRCAYCVYRSLCEKGMSAGPSDGDEFLFTDDTPEEILSDFEQIAEIEY